MISAEDRDNYLRITAHYLTTFRHDPEFLHEAVSFVNVLDEYSMAGIDVPMTYTSRRFRKTLPHSTEPW